MEAHTGPTGGRQHTNSLPSVRSSLSRRAVTNINININTNTILQQATQELDKNICDIFPLKVLFFYTTVTQEDASMETITFEGGQSLI